MIKINEDYKKSLVHGSFAIYFVMLMSSMSLLGLPDAYLAAMALVLLPALVFGKSLYRIAAIAALIFALGLIVLNIAIRTT